MYISNNYLVISTHIFNFVSNLTDVIATDVSRYNATKISKFFTQHAQ